MTQYIKVGPNGDVTKTSIGLIRKENPNVSFSESPSDDQLAYFNVFPLLNEEPPAAGENQEVVAGPIVQENGVWTQTYEVVDLPITSEVLNEYRAQRIEEGSTFTVGQKSIRIRGDRQTRENMDALALAAFIRLSQNNLTHVTQYRDADNVIHQLLPPEVLDLWSQAAAFVESVYVASWDIKDDLAGPPRNYKADGRWPR